MSAKKILVIDNEDDPRHMIKHILERIGYFVEAAQTPDEALSLQSKQDFDLIITDLIMPDMDGVELCEKIRELDPKAIVYAYTGYLDLYEDKKIKRANFNGIIPKPVQIEELEKTIRNALGE